MADTLTHPVLGKLLWEEPYLWWLGSLRLESRAWIDVMIVPGKQDRFAFADAASQLFQRAMASELALRRAATDLKALELYSSWRKEDEPALTAEELSQRLELVAVRLDTVVPISLGYVVGGGLEDVFGGRFIDVSVDASLGITDVRLAG